MALTTCIECHGSISDSASQCPGCSTREPFGTICELCGVRMRRSTGITSVRREKEVSRGDRDSHRDRSWFFRGDTNRAIVAHRECLDRFYTPPSTLHCSDCTHRFITSELGLTPLTLWNATARLAFACPRCGAYCSLSTAQCKWAPKPSPHVTSIFETLLDANPCLRPFYAFQEGPNGQGHGQHIDQERTEARERASAEAEQVRARAFHNQVKANRVQEWMWIGIKTGALFGVVAGICVAVGSQSFSAAIGKWIGSLVVFGGVGGAIGFMVGSVLE